MTNAVSLAEVILSSLAILFAIASFFTKDNFYSALYMCMTMLIIAGIYAYFGIHSSFALISLIFIGALGVITLVLAYSYRRQKSIEFKLRWMAFAFIIIIFINLTLPIIMITATKDYLDSIPNFRPIHMLFALLILIMFTLIEIWREKS
jgi:NADH:ubiquinone oxidoreductase subunit 6 (subunit J)